MKETQLKGYKDNLKRATTDKQKASAKRSIRRLKDDLKFLKPSIWTRARRRRGHDDELRPGHREWDFDS